MPRSIIAWNGLEDGLLRNPRFTQAWTAAHPRTSRTPCFVDGLLFLASQRTIAPMNLVTLDWNREPHLCEAVIRETQEYRRRDPLPLAPAEPLELVPVHPAPRPAPVEPYLDGVLSPLDQDFREVYQHLLLLPRRALQHPEALNFDGMMQAAVDWSQRNRAVFCSPAGPRWLQRGTRAAAAYKCVMDELIHDLRSVIDWLHAIWQGIPDEPTGHAALSRLMVHVEVIFVRPSMHLFTS